MLIKSVIIASILMFSYGCSQVNGPPSSYAKINETKCQQLSTQMAKLHNKINQPSANSTQIQNSELMREYHEYNCMAE